ncbi:hypothetical protein IAU60_000739 [Kwoniella sp. DSM 27419]
MPHGSPVSPRFDPTVRTRDSPVSPLMEKPWSTPASRQPHQDRKGVPPRQADTTPVGSLWSRSHDRWWAVTFGVNALLYNVVAVYAVYCLVTDYDLGDLGKIADTDTTVTVSGGVGRLDSQTITSIAMAMGLAVLLGAVVLFCVRTFPAFMIWAGPVGLCLVTCGAIGLCAYGSAWSVAGVLLIPLTIVVLSLFLLRGRIELARHLLDTANKAAKEHRSVFRIVLIGLLVSTIHSVWNFFALVAVYMRFLPGNKACDTSGWCSLGTVLALTAYLILSYLWISAVISNVVSLTVAGGPYTQWWTGKQIQSSSESLFALKNAMGVSFGSVAFGGLFVGPIETLNFCLKLLSGQLFGYDSCARCCCCILDVCEKLLHIFNKYVVVRIGVSEFRYGYLQCARETVVFVRNKNRKETTGLSALVGDSIAGFALHFTSIANALLCVVVTLAYTWVTDGTARMGSLVDWVILFYTFIVTLNIGLTMTSALEAGVSTIFVCLDQHPQQLGHRNKQFYDYLMSHQRYSAVLQEGRGPRGV